MRYNLFVLILLVLFSLTMAAQDIHTHVFRDLNGNGIDNAEPGLAGLTVTLFVDANFNGLPNPGEELGVMAEIGGGDYEFIGAPLATDLIITYSRMGTGLTNPLATVPYSGAPTDNDLDSDVVEAPPGLTPLRTTVFQLVNTPLEEFVDAGMISGAAQTVYEDCAGAGAPDPLPVGPVTVTFAGATLDADYDPPSISAVSNGFLHFTVATPGLYDINILTGATTATGDISIGVGLDCASLAEVASGDVAAWNTTCVNLAAGDFFLAVAFEGAAGDIELEFTSATPIVNDDCASATTVSTGATTGLDNLCSVDGTVWYTYTVTNGGEMDFVVTPGTLSGASILSATLNGCGGTDILNAWDCLSAGDVVTLEIGGSPTDYGDFDLTITDNTTAIGNDDCFISAGVTLVCGPVPVTFVGTAGACYDPEAELGGCIPTNLTAAGGVPETATGGVWNSLTIDPALPAATVSGSGFEVFIGSDCNTLTSLGCAMTELDPAVDGANHHILVFDGGIFTATPQPLPSNDLCAAST